MPRYDATCMQIQNTFSFSRYWSIYASEIFVVNFGKCIFADVFAELIKIVKLRISSRDVSAKCTAESKKKYIPIR